MCMPFFVLFTFQIPLTGCMPEALPVTLSESYYCHLVIAFAQQNDKTKRKCL